MHQCEQDCTEFSASDPRTGELEAHIAFTAIRAPSASVGLLEKKIPGGTESITLPGL